ncbi:MAG: class I SAM-dependent methyltransferase [Candidatus Omnitrophica bacterium]|nr:class I SAM-dependent methyltransferase [Candidatus Omnitrophota bacterium]
MGKLMDALRLPELEGVDDLDDASTTELHREIILKKGFLKKIYVDLYQQYNDVIREYDEHGLFVELGSGGGFVKSKLPGVITSDILSLSHIDICFNAEAIPFRDHSVDAFFMIDVLHHIKNPAKIIQEMNRCLKKGGRVLMTEPANTAWSRFIYQNFHHENFDPTSGWLIEGTGPMSSANGALLWIIFFRDVEKFNNDFPSLNITKKMNHTPFRYLVSGGVSMKQLLPTWTYGFFKGFEWILTPFSNLLGMFCTVELKKK